MAWTRESDPRARTRLVAMAAFVVGLLPAFFVAFNVVFTDVFGFWERVWSLAYVFGAYLLFGAVFGVPGGADRRWVAGALALPAVLVLAGYATREPQDVALHAGVAVLAVAGAFLGVLLMQTIRSRGAR